MFQTLWIGRLSTESELLGRGSKDTWRDCYMRSDFKAEWGLLWGSRGFEPSQQRREDCAKALRCGIARNLQKIEHHVQSTE